MFIIRHVRTGDWWDGGEWVGEDFALEYESEPTFLPKDGVCIEQKEKEPEEHGYRVTWSETAYYSVDVVAADEDAALEEAAAARDSGGLVDCEDTEESRMDVEEL